PAAGGALREVARRHVDAESHEVREEEAVVDAGDDLMKGRRAALHDEVARPDARGPAHPADGVSRGTVSRLPRRIRVEEEPAERTSHDDGVLARRDALAVKRPR